MRWRPQNRRGEILAGDNMRLIAYCTSTRCARVYATLNHLSGPPEQVRKDVGPHETYCPDCGYILFWKKEKAY